MSKKSKNRSSARRRAEKAQRKASKRALYESYRDRGVNTKSKRFIKKKKVTTHAKHPERPCGNPGCISCYGVDFMAFINKDGSHPNMPQRMYQKWMNLSAQTRLAIYENHYKQKLDLFHYKKVV